MKKNFVFDIYNFKKVAIIIITIPTMILLIISSILPTTEQNSPQDKSKDKSVYENIEKIIENKIFSICIITIIIIIYISRNFGLSYNEVKTKVLMDLRYISRYKIIFYVGICGVIIIIIFLIIISFIKCSESMENFCKVKNPNNTTELYIDNPLFYFQDMSSLGKKIYLEILVIIFFLFLNFFEYYFEISIIYHFDPNYIMVRDSIYNLVIRIGFIILNVKDYEEYISLPQFIILEIAEIISLIGFSIYLEIIELRFCELDIYLKRNISQRASLSNIFNDYSIDDIVNDEIDDNNDGSNSAYE